MPKLITCIQCREKRPLYLSIDDRRYCRKCGRSYEPLFAVHHQVVDAECSECNRTLPVVFWCDTPNWADRLCLACLHCYVATWAEA